MSVPKVKSACLAATAAAEPLEDPPGISSGYLGLMGVPKAWLMPVIPKPIRANLFSQEFHSLLLKCF